MKNNNVFSVSFICSVILHLLLMYFFIFGLPSLFRPLPEEQVIVLQMLPVSNKSNVPNKTKQLEKSIENEDAKKVEQSKPDYTEDKKPVDSIVEKAVEKPIKKVVEENKVIEEKKLAETKLPDEKPKLVDSKPIEEKKLIEDKKPIEDKKILDEKKPVEEKKPVDKKRKIPDKKYLDALLKNLEQSSEGANAKSNKQARSKENKETQESKGPYDERLDLSITEISLIKQQIEKIWNKPIGIQNLDRLRVTLYIALNKDGSVKKVTIKETICPNVTQAACDALSDSAIRAVWQASPINNLDPQRYNSWKEFNFLFDPGNSYSP